MSAINLVTLPIGNVEDLTLRARKVLEEQDYFLAEDTRVFKQLLNYLGIDTSSKRIDSFHDHTDSKITYLINQLDNGTDLYIVSDAGSPIISDPGYPLIRAAIRSGHDVNTVPGVTAVITALELSGLPPHPFHFHGFLPREEERKKTTFSQTQTSAGTHIFFDAPTRIEKTLKALALVLPEVDVCAARELTKKFETAVRFKAKDFVPDMINAKGEFVLLYHIDKENLKASGSGDKLQKLADEYMNKKSTPKQLAKILGEILGENPKDIYANLTKQN